MLQRECARKRFLSVHILGWSYFMLLKNKSHLHYKPKNITVALSLVLNLPVLFVSVVSSLPQLFPSPLITFFSGNIMVFLWKCSVIVPVFCQYTGEIVHTCNRTLLWLSISAAIPNKIIVKIFSCSFWGQRLFASFLLKLHAAVLFS